MSVNGECCPITGQLLSLASRIAVSIELGLVKLEGEGGGRNKATSWVRALGFS